MSTGSTRRDFVATSGTMVGGAWLALHLPAVQAAAAHARRALARRAPFEVLTPEEAIELEAVAAQIIPTDDTPGAREAGVIYFMDKALGTFGAQFLQPIRGGLPDLLKAARAKHPAVRGFAELSFEQQTDVLRGMEQTPFFGAVRFLTVAGMFGDPSYGGNQDRIGWQLIGFDGGHAHQPPFGYYDANQR
ncbi:MAG: gluconate 2-dehydrogenase subunit 3 family protein [Gemmatimonadetes bacterium]|nr:gluconate 2-dehydrogenase subunit 3 family protein [Gemmatimonadota bacterium]